jgi:hypothetical protein
MLISPNFNSPADLRSTELFLSIFWQVTDCEKNNRALKRTDIILKAGFLIEKYKFIIQVFISY